MVVPSLGIGVWSWGDSRFWGYGKDYSREDLRQAYKTCLDTGINFFDTAEIYGGGESERILGACIQEDGRPVIIASKFAPLPNKTIAQVALNWLLSRDELIIPIPGAKNARQARENSGALGWRLSEEEMKQIEHATEE